MKTRPHEFAPVVRQHAGANVRPVGRSMASITMRADSKPTDQISRQSQLYVYQLTSEIAEIKTFLPN